MNEFARWCPESGRCASTGRSPIAPPSLGMSSSPGLSRRDYDVVVPTYEVANAENKSLKKVSWRFVVIDEAHRIKNEASLFARTARSLRAERRLRDRARPCRKTRALGAVEFSITRRLRVGPYEWCAPVCPCINHARAASRRRTDRSTSHRRDALGDRIAPKSPQNRKTNRPPPPFPEATSCEPPVSLRGRAGSILMWTMMMLRKR